MAVPSAINTSDESSKTKTTVPSTSLDSQQPNPEFTLTPATPSTPHQSTNKVAEPLPIPGEIKEDKMREKEGTTDSQTALVGQEDRSKKAGSGSGPIDTLTRKLSSRSKSSTSGEKKTTTPAAVTTEKTPAATSSSSGPANATRSNVAKKPTPKKKKRSGFSGFLLRMGCLSADEFEDPEPKKGASTSTNAKTTTPGSSASTSAATKAPAPAETKASTPKEVKSAVTPAATTSPKTEITSPAAAVLATGTDKDKDNSEGLGQQPKAGDETVVASHEPTIPSEEETAGMTSSAVQAPGSGSTLLSTPVRPSSSRRQSGSSPSSASPEGEPTETSGGYSNISESEIPDESSGAAGAATYPEEYGLEEEYEDDEDRLIAPGGIGIPVDENGNPAPLLRPMDPDHVGRKCLVLDLDETLLHSSFKMLPSADYIVPVEIESQTHNVYVIKRPGVDNFLTEMGKIYEVVVFTASLSKYADPVMDMLDPARVIRHRLFRESCYNHKGNYVKDLSQLGRDMESSIIIDNSPASYIFHPNNAVPVSTWFNDPHDTELTDLCPFLTDLATVEDIRGVLDGSI